MGLIHGFTANQWNDIVPTENTHFYVNECIREYSLRPNQRDVFEKYYYEKFFIMEEPSGAGKSTTLKFVFLKKLMSDLSHKLIIAIPQTFISKSFGSAFLRYNDQETLEWNIGQNLCEKIPSSKKSKIIDFMNKKKFNAGVEERILITTHLALAQAYEDICKLNNKSSLFRNTSFVIDEAHHVLYPENGSVEYSNKIGRLVQYITEKNDPSTNLWLSSSTFFRGDKAPIIPQDTINKFTKYFLPFDIHWKRNIENIKSFSFDFIVYKDNPFNELKMLLKKQKRKTIIFCPYNGMLINGDKYSFRDLLISEIRKVWKDANIVDLIDENGREEQKQFIYDDKISKDVDIILSVKIFDEGADWIFAEQIIDLVPTSSLRVQGQRNGRLWRDCKGKYHVHYYMFLPFVSKTLDENAYRELLSQNYAAFITSILIQEAVDPISNVNTITDKKNNGGSTYQSAPNPFIQAVPDPSKRSIIIDGVIRELISLYSDYNKIPPKDEIKNCIENKIRNYSIENDVDEIVVYIVKLLRRSIPKYNLDVSWMLDAGFDKIWKNDIFDRILSFGTGVTGIKSFEEFRNVYHLKNNSPEYYVRKAEELCHEHGGILPPFTWIKKNVSHKLADFIRKNKHLLSHLKQEVLWSKNINSHISDAERIAEEHGGILPNPQWLTNNGKSRLACAMRKYREAFSHIEQHRLVKKLEVRVKEAEALAAENGGILPHLAWILKHNEGLAGFIRQHPEMVSHIQMESKKGVSLSDRVKEAEALAAENGGILPIRNKLRVAGYKGLIAAIERCPNAFSHIQMNRKKIIPKLEVRVKEAEALAAENGGILPNYAWIEKYYDVHLANCIRRNPKMFSHILRDRKNKSILERVKEAEKIAAENGGILPIKNQLCKEGRVSLATAISRNPQYFIHIPQFIVIGKGKPIIKDCRKEKEYA